MSSPPSTSTRPPSTPSSPTIDGQEAIDPICEAGAASRLRRGREFCGRPDQHPYELFLRLEGITHKTTQVRRPQSPVSFADIPPGDRPLADGIVERLHRTLLDEHLRVQGRTVWHETVQEMQDALDLYLDRYNRERPHRAAA